LAAEPEPSSNTTFKHLQRERECNPTQPGQIIARFAREPLDNTKEGEAGATAEVCATTAQSPFALLTHTFEKSYLIGKKNATRHSRANHRQNRAGKPRRHQRDGIQRTPLNVRGVRCPQVRKPGNSTTSCCRHLEANLISLFRPPPCSFDRFPLPRCAEPGAKESQEARATQGTKQRWSAKV